VGPANGLFGRSNHPTWRVETTKRFEKMTIASLVDDWINENLDES
jgi:hypothetical protein